MKISVVIPCLNVAETIAAQLEALVEQKDWTEPWEVIISDNGSTDQSLAIISAYRSQLPNLRIVDSSDRVGAAHARNVGVQAATGDGILFCDADDRVSPNWLRSMGAALNQHDFVACLLVETEVNTLWQQKSWNNFQKHDLIHTFINDLPFAGTGTLGIRQSLHFDVGGFDESFLNFEDADYCWRVQLFGTKLHLVADAFVHYRYKTKLRDIFRQARTNSTYSVLLHKKYRHLGMSDPIASSWKYLKDWGRLLLHVPQLVDKRGQSQWVRKLGSHIGKLEGTVRFRGVQSSRTSSNSRSS